MNKLPAPDPSFAKSWQGAIDDLERTIADGLSEVEPNFLTEFAKTLPSLVALTRRIGATQYGQRYRAGTFLRSTLKISTAAQYGLKADETYIEVTVERLEHGDYGFVIRYFEGGYASDAICALRRSYDTENHNVIEANLRRDMPNYYYPCEHADAWETLQPLMIRLWDETHSEHSLDTEQKCQDTPLP